MRASLAEVGAGTARQEGALRVFFPLLYLFLCYQAGYILLALAAVWAKLLRGLFSGAAAGPGGVGAVRPEGRTRRPFLSRAASGLWLAARPVLAATVAAAAVSPQTAVQVIERTVSAALQAEGFGVGLLDPLLLSGVPFPTDWPFGQRPGVSAIGWIVFLAALGAACAVALRRGAAAIPGRDAAGFKAALLYFATLLASYLGAFAWRGDVYSVWKALSLTALPLSFLPTAILASALFAAFRGRGRPFAAACAFLAAALSVAHAFHGGPGEERRQIKDMRSLLPVYGAVEAALDFDRGKDLVVFDFSEPERNFAAMVVSQYRQYRARGRVAFVDEDIYRTSVLDYLGIAESGAPVYSDRLYPGLYRGSAEPTPPEFTVYRYDAGILRRYGAVSFSGIEPYTRNPNRRSVKLRILVPSGLSGRDLLVRVSFAEGLEGTDPSCAPPTAREEGAPPSDAVAREGGEFLIRAPAGWQRSGSLRLALDFPELPLSPRPDGVAWDWRDPPACRYRFDAVEVFPDGPPPGEGGGAGQS
jgi:hypothetical protein